VPGDIANAIKKPLAWTAALAQILNDLLHPSFWLRALKVVAGLVLAILALRMLAQSATQSGSSA
jgi:putative Ca2+/H+ antiporter (TMEM165/GDT1 family)